jgi:hypothetical protein
MLVLEGIVDSNPILAVAHGLNITLF